MTALSAGSDAFPLLYAQAAECAFKCAAKAPEAHALNVYQRKAAEAVKTQTDGRFELHLFPNNPFGGDADMVSQLRSGALETVLLSGVNVPSTLAAASAMSGAGFGFTDYHAVWTALDGKVGAYLRQKVAGGGIVALEKVCDNGFRQNTASSKPIPTPDDLRGARMRVPVSALCASLFEMQKFCSVTSHMWEGWRFPINRRAREGVRADLREKVAAIINDHAMEQRVDERAVRRAAAGRLEAGAAARH